MKIKPTVSCEFFPPDTDEKLAKLVQTAIKLEVMQPEFFSVTYGAGGSIRDLTQNVVHHLAQKLNASIVPHLSCIGSTKENIRNILLDYKNKGIRHILALRGDLPSGVRDIGEFKYANELVEFIRHETGDHFDITVAAYPDFHPESRSPYKDLENFKRKIDAGANRAITQLFFNTDAYFYFLDDCARTGIDVPIIPGIIPIHNWTQLKKFTHTCESDIPAWLQKRMDSFEDEVESVRSYGCEIMTKLCERLLENGVKELHFYTLNQSKPTLKICEHLGLIN
jgi:methylenetetrahydrofolate reductase (NADPH)